MTKNLNNKKGIKIRKKKLTSDFIYREIEVTICLPIPFIFSQQYSCFFFFTEIKTKVFVVFFFYASNLNFRTIRQPNLF